MKYDLDHISTGRAPRMALETLYAVIVIKKNGDIHSLPIEDNEFSFPVICDTLPCPIQTRKDPLPSMIRRWQIKSLKSRNDASRLSCVSLANEFEKALTDAESAKISVRPERALAAQVSTLQQFIRWLETQEQEQPKSQT